MCTDLCVHARLDSRPGVDRGVWLRRWVFAEQAKPRSRLAMGSAALVGGLTG